MITNILLFKQTPFHRHYELMRIRLFELGLNIELNSNNRIHFEHF